MMGSSIIAENPAKRSILILVAAVMITGTIVLVVSVPFRHHYRPKQQRQQGFRFGGYHFPIQNENTNTTLNCDITTLNTSDTKFHQESLISGTSGKLFQGEKIRQYGEITIFNGQTLEELEQHFKVHDEIPPDTAIEVDTNFMCDKWSVVTTISEPTVAVERQALLQDWCTVVVGDRKGPFEYPILNVDENKLIFLTADHQQRLAATSPLVKMLPWNHFGRKNIGYLYAIAHGAKFIYDFDDDNVLISKHRNFHMPGAGVRFSHFDEKITNKTNYAGGGNLITLMRPSNYSELVFNPYPLFGATSNPSWPRGYPLELIKPTYPSLAFPIPTEMVHLSPDRIGVIQYLANHDPDVDAIYRLTQPLPLNFAPKHTSIVLPGKTVSGSSRVYCPYNAQATLHTHDALWTLLLPVTVHGRVSDIWRSYFAQRLLSDLGLQVVFHSPVVIQDRNAHNYLADFDSEEPLYKKSLRLIQQLEEWTTCATSLPGRIEELWIMLYEHGYIDLPDVKLVQSWLESLFIIGYKFPSVKPDSSCEPKIIEIHQLS